MSKHIILAFDPGSVTTGWCVGQDSQYCASGVLRLQGRRSDKRTIWERVALLSGLVRAMIEDHVPDVIGVEWPMGPGGNAAKIKLGMILGVIGAEAGSAGVPILEVNPTEVKDTKCSKDNLVYAGAIAGRDVRKDEADAIGAYLALDGKLFGLTIREAERMWGLHWSTR